MRVLTLATPHAWRKCGHFTIALRWPDTSPLESPQHVVATGDVQTTDLDVQVSDCRLGRGDTVLLALVAGLRTSRQLHGHAVHQPASAVGHMPASLVLLLRPSYATARPGDSTSSGPRGDDRDKGTVGALVYGAEDPGGDACPGVPAQF